MLVAERFGADLSDAEVCAGLIGQVSERLGSVDVLVPAAGGLTLGLASRLAG